MQTETCVEGDDGHIGEYSQRFIRKMLSSYKMSNWGTALTWDNQIYNDPVEKAIWGDEPLTYQEVMNGKYKSGMFRLVDTLVSTALLVATFLSDGKLGKMGCCCYRRGSKQPRSDQETS